MPEKLSEKSKENKLSALCGLETDSEYVKRISKEGRYYAKNIFAYGPVFNSL